MKQVLIYALIAGLTLSSAAFAQTEAASNDDTSASKERERGERDDRGDNDRRNGRNGNNDLSGRALRVIDTDEDGQVSVEEYMAHAQQRFEDLDIDGNNFVTSEEAKEAAEIMREKQKEARSELNKRKSTSETE